MRAALVLVLVLVGCGEPACQMVVCDCYADGQAIPRGCATAADCQRECVVQVAL